MDFTFTEDQLLFQESVRSFLVNEVTPERIRQSWDTESGRDEALWASLVEMGLTGLCMPEAFDGMGMAPLDFVLLAMECGYVALPEPLVHQAMVATPVLLASGNEGLQSEWLPKIASGEAKVMVGSALNPLVEDAHIADLLLLERDGAFYALTADQCSLRRNESVDPSRRLFAVEFDASASVPVAEGETAKAMSDAAVNGGALASAAQSLGLAQRMVDISVQYTSERKQFGAPIGSFQAVKHHMANIAYKLEYAKAPLYRAASMAEAGEATQALNVAVSHAKLAADEVAQLAAKNSIQVHGAMGYTWEVDLHIFMKKAWALAGQFGDAGYHKARVNDWLFSDDALIRAAHTFS